MKKGVPMKVRAGLTIDDDPKSAGIEGALDMDLFGFTVTPSSPEAPLF